MSAALSPVEWQAARLAAGEDVPDASDEARALAAQALSGSSRQVMDDLAEAMRAGYTPSGQSGPRVSDYGGCGRAVWYRERPPEGYVPVELDESRATLGQVIHKAGEADGAARYPWRRYEFPVAIPGLDKPGRIDRYDPIIGEVADTKTAGRAKWDMFASGPPASAWGQVMIYGLALEEMGLPVRTVAIIAINRDTGAEEHFHRPYDPAVARSALDELVALGTLLDLGIVPPREGTGPSRFPCSWCPARDHCWNIPAAEAAGRSPESYTILGEDPEDAIIEWAARQLYERRQKATAADRAKDEAAALLVGVKYGPYGEMEVYRGGGGSKPDYKAWAEMLLQMLALPEDQRPPLETLSEPPRRHDKPWIGVKKVRTAARKSRAKKTPD